MSLPEPGEPGSLGYGQPVTIDTSTPYVTSVTSAYPNGTYTAGATMEVFIDFSAPVALHGYAGCKDSVGGTLASRTASSGGFDAKVVTCEDFPRLVMDSSGGLGDVNATYAWGNETKRLVFKFEVRFS